MNYEERLHAALVDLHAKLFNASGELKDLYAQYTPCPVCGDDAPEIYCVKDGFKYWTCKSCSMIYMNPRLNKDATLAFYNSEANEIYNEAKFHAAPQGGSADDWINEQNLHLILRHVSGSAQPQPLSGKRVLEIGCAKGFFLKQARAMGADVYGIELNEVNSEIARRDLGECIYDRDVLELQLASNHFDVIYSRDVIEHIHDPLPLLRELCRITKPGGMIFTETHNIQGAIHRTVGSRHTCIFGLEHPVHWSPVTLSYAMRKCGFETKKIYFESRDFLIQEILIYFRQSTWTTIFSWRAPRLWGWMLKALSAPFRIPLVRKLDAAVTPRIAQACGAGSTMKLIAFKSGSE